MQCTTQNENIEATPSFPPAKTDKFSSDYPSAIRNFPTTFTGFGMLSVSLTVNSQVLPILIEAVPTYEKRLVRAGLVFFWVLNSSKPSLVFCFFPTVQASLRQYVTSHYFTGLALPSSSRRDRLPCNIGDSCTSISLRTH